MKNATTWRMAVLLFTLLLSANSFSQVFFTEDFEGTPNATTDLPTGWTEVGLSTDGIWSTGDAAQATSPYLTWPAPSNGTLFAYTNDDACNCDKSADGINLPVQDFSGMVGVSMECDVFLNGGYGETMYTRVSLNGGATWDTVYTVVGAGNVWQDNIQISLNAYAGLSNVLIQFMYSDAATWAFAGGLDDVVLTELAGTDDLEMLAFEDEYTSIPVDQVIQQNLTGVVTNNGLSAVSDVVVTTDIYLGGILQTSVSSAPTNVPAGDTVSILAGTYTPSTLGNYEYYYSVSSASITDATPSNDTLLHSFEVDVNSYERHNDNIQLALGINGTGNTGTLGNLFEVNTTQILDSISSFHNTGVAGDTITYVVYDVVAGVPSTQIGMSENYIVTTADETNGLFTGSAHVTDLTSNPLQLSPGTYLIAAVESLGTNNGALGFAPSIYTDSTVFGRVNGGAWATLTALGFDNLTAMVTGHFVSCFATSDTTSVTACDSYTWPVTGASYTSSGFYSDTLTSVQGCDSVLIIDLTINISTSETVTASGCNDYTWAQNGMTYSATGMYVDTITNVAGCDSVVTLDLTIGGLNATTTLNGETLLSDLTGPQFTYQWIDCDNNNSAIPNATMPSFSPQVSGNYAVIVTDGNCSDTSACAAVTVTIGLEELNGENWVQIAPNPTNDQLNVSISNDFSEAIILVRDLKGSAVLSAEINSNSGASKQISLKHLEQGMYIVDIILDGSDRVMKRIQLVK